MGLSSCFAWVVCALLLLGVNATPASNPFEVYNFYVGQADCQLIRFPSGYTILYDLGELSWNSQKTAESIAERLDDILGGRHINVLVISHLHLDHIGYAGVGGLWHLVENLGFTFDQFVDRNAGLYKGSFPCDYDNLDEADITFYHGGSRSNTFDRWVCWVSDPANPLYSVREIAKVGSSTQISPPDSDASVTIVAADGEGVYFPNGQELTGDHTRDDLPPSENDYSIGLHVRFGEIDYVLAGDASGYHVENHQFEFQYNDVETPLANRLNGVEVEVFRVNHHGSGHSTNDDFVRMMRPTVSIISCGIDSKYDHPDQRVLDQLLSVGDVYLPNICSPDREYGSTVFVNGDVLLQSWDGSSFYIAGNRYDTKESLLRKQFSSIQL